MLLLFDHLLGFFLIIGFVRSGEEKVFQWVRVVEAPFALSGDNEDNGRVRIWGSREETFDFSGLNHTFTKFLGIPFGVAPNGTLRFQVLKMKIALGI